MSNSNSGYQLYVVDKPFSSGELGASFKKGEVLEVDMEKRQVNWQGSSKSVKSVITAIRQGWIRQARKDEIDFIKKTGYAPSRRFEGPNLTKIAQDRHQQMQESIPEDLRGEKSHIEEVSDSRTLNEVSVKDQYNAHENQRPTERPKSASERPSVPQTTAQKLQEDDTAADEASMGDVDVHEAIARAAAEEVDAQEAASKTAVPHFDQSEIYPKECRIDFDYKKRLSVEREDELRKMPLGDLQHLALFLKGRDKREEYPRKITARVWEILEERKKSEQKKAAAAHQAKEPTRDLPEKEHQPALEKEDPGFPFPFNVNADQGTQIHQLSMNLTIDQAEMVLSYYEKIDPPFAKKIREIIQNRRRRGAKKSSEDENGEVVLRSSALPPSEAGLISAMAGTPAPGSMMKQAAKNVIEGAIGNASDQDIVNASQADQMDISMLAGADSADVSPVDSIEGETEAINVGNRPAPREAQSIIGSEEGRSTAMSISGRLAQNAAREGIRPSDGVEDVSGTIGQIE